MRFSLFFRRLRPRHYAGGLLVLSLIVGVYGLSLNAVLTVGDFSHWQAWFADPYLRRIILFSFAQAFLSAFLSVAIGMIFARAFFYQNFIGKAWLLKIFSLTFVLPALVAVFGLLGVYGGSGWLAKSAAWLGLSWQPNIYGLSGILIAHLFFNIPLAARMFLQGLAAIPNQQRQLAAQLNICGWRFIRLIELPYLRQQLLPTFVLIFMLCFTSFTIVLALGGGPQYTTLEVAIYQAIVFDFDLPKAALFSLLQFAFCLVLFGLISRLSNMRASAVSNKEQWRSKQQPAVQWWQMFVIVSVSLFIFLPLLNTLISAVFSGYFLSAWQDGQLWRAIGYSVTIAPISALVAVISAAALLLLSRQLTWLHFSHLANGLMNIGMIILAVPTLVLSIGLFLLLQTLDFNTAHLFAIVVLCNALSALPFVIRILAAPMNNNMIYYEKLCQSLGVTGWNRLSLIEWRQLAAPIKYAFALAACLSLGDFTAIALFGSRDFTSLPYLLYQQLGSYRGDQAAVTALILLLFCLGVFWLAERQDDGKDVNDDSAQ
ncbi:thiamine/thiamine pyrophosphate ABC transporter permease ThiP [Pasteurellaceae bacterium LIM206]|nr:thiamine/thiamine pyrophosphate ABC transporter permease ThiP [Pasteurellaceae bacterium LIM206]